MKIFLQQMIATEPRDCDNCGTESAIGEGQVYWRDKTEARWCAVCVEYERQHEV